MPGKPILLFLIAALATTLSLSIASNAWAEAPAGQAQTIYTVPHVPAQILVKRAPGVQTTLIEQILSGLGGTILDFSASADIDVVGITDDGDLEAAIDLLNADVGIEFAEPNFTSNLWTQPNDTDFPLQWSKNNTGINSPSGLGNPGADMNLVDAWDTQSTAPGIIVAVIDDSMETTHIDLAANVLLTDRCFASPSSNRPCVNGPNNANPVDAGDFHGTLVAGTAAARGNNAIGIAGAAWETGLLAIKVDLSYFAIVQAIDEAIAQSADIINMSFGGPIQSQSLTEAMARAEAAGILMIASAGNADASNDIASHYPSNDQLDNVISVAATNSRDRVSGFSQWGSTSVHLAAPGEGIRTTANGNGYATVNGTSFSAPHVSGVAALVYAASGASDYAQVKAHLLHGTVNGRDPVGSVTPGQDKEAVPGRVATGRLDADMAITGPAGGVLTVSDIQINDTATGNSNGRLDPGETAQMQITIDNAWTAESGVEGTLSTTDSGSIFVNDVVPISFGTIGNGAQATAAFSVTLSNTVDGNEFLFMQLDLDSASGALPSRYFYLEVGTLRNGETVTQNAQRNNWDEFHAFHVDVPAGASDLNIATTGTGDIDLLVRFNRSPEYLITLNATPGTGFYYVDSETTISSGAGASESYSLANPLPGTYHAVVVNYDKLPKTYDITATYDLPTAGEIVFTQGAYSVAENGTTATITVTRSGGVGGATVEYATANQTATAGDDYLAATGVLVWGLNENGSKTFSVSILDDQDSEPTETVLLALSNVVGSTLGAQSTATLQIIDDELSPGTLSFTQQSLSVSEATSQVAVSVSRAGGSAGAVSVDYSTQNGQAVAGSDFVASAGTLNWADGDSAAKTINVSITNDASQENQESFSITLSNPQGAAIGAPATATITIIDDELAAAGGGSGGGGRFDLLTLMALFMLWLAQSNRSFTKRSCRRII